jgi:BASS family bile acid:Na+ symporter
MSLENALKVVLPAITFFLMTIVGMDLTMVDFRKVRNSPKAFWVGTLGQFSLPLCAWLLLELLQPIPAVFAGMILVATAPAGGISTYYSHVARVNVALSLVLTTVSSLCASLTMPLFLRFFQFLLPQVSSFKMPLKVLFGQLFLLLVLPVLLGFVIRSFYPKFFVRFSKPLRRIGFIALGCLITLIFVRTWDLLVSSWLGIVKAAVVFVLCSMSLGYFFGFLFKLDRRDSFTLLIEFGVRNIAITIAAAVAILQRSDFATFGAIYFLVEAVLILPAIFVFRRTWNSVNT